MNDARRCKAVRRGQQCRKAAIRGGAVCQTHGGGAPQVKRKAAERLADLIDPDRTLREAARVAFSDIRELFDAQGRLKSPADWPDDFAAAVGAFEVLRRVSATGQADEVVKVKLWDKVKALQLLFRHLGLLKDRAEVGGTVTVRWADDVVDRLHAARARLNAVQRDT